jgi:hypothetical protein
LKITALYVGSSLLSPLKKAESDIHNLYSLGLTVAAHNCGAPLSAEEWQAAERDILGSQIVFIIHVTDDSNAARISRAVKQAARAGSTVVAFNCMPELMRLTRMGRLEFARLSRPSPPNDSGGDDGKEASARKPRD